MKTKPIDLMCANGTRTVRMTPVAVWDYNLNPPIKCITHKDLATPSCYTVSEYYTGLNIFQVADRLHSRPELATAMAIQRLDSFTPAHIIECGKKFKTINP